MTYTTDILIDMNIGFIGQGWIGRNYADVFEKKGFSVMRYSLEEPYRSNKEQLLDCSIVFIAVPTPTIDGRFDSSAVEESLSLLSPKSTAVIKSTLLPGTTKKLQEKFPDIFVFHSPEFLREAQARYDAEFPERNIVGIPLVSEETLKKAEEVMSILPRAPYNKIIGATEAELVKYAGNCYLYQKVVFFNLLYDLSSSLDANYEEIREAVTKDSRIPESHTKVLHASGHTPDIKKRGAGGHCFIKDYEAYTDLYEQQLPHDKEGSCVLNSIKEKNYSYLTEGGKDIDLLKNVARKETPLYKKIYMKLFPHKNALLSLFLCSLLFLGIIFGKQGLHNVYNDTTVYANQVLFFDGQLKDISSIQYHFFKPLYGIVGAFLHPILSVYSSLLAINIFFYFGLGFCVYVLFRKLGIEEKLSFAGALWVISGYPLLKYGLALLTDISGWFFSVLTIVLFLLAKERNFSPKLLALTSVIGFLGSTSKETGVLGLIVAGSFVVFSSIYEKNSKRLLALIPLSLPALLLQIGLILTTLHYSNKTIVDWISFNISTNTTEKFHSFYYFSLTELATFHILWLYAFVGIIYALQRTLYRDKASVILWFSIFIGTIPVLFWPLFYIRIFYIQFLVIIPLALLGVKALAEYYKNPLVTNTLIFIPVVISGILFSVAGNSSLFDLLSYAVSFIK